jgi:SAM-dependent methyltransferase
MHLPNVEARQCDITEDSVESGHYDLVHSRLLLMHLGDPADVLRRMSDALRPGGWTEEIDNAVAGSIDGTHQLAEAFDVCYRQRIDFALDAGVMDLCFARVLPAYVEALGFVEVGNEGVAHVVRGGEPLPTLSAQSFQELDSTPNWSPRPGYRLPSGRRTACICGSDLPLPRPACAVDLGSQARSVKASCANGRHSTVNSQF